MFGNFRTIHHVPVPPSELALNLNRWPFMRYRKNSIDYDGLDAESVDITVIFHLQCHVFNTMLWCMPCVHTAVVQSSVQKLRLSTLLFFCRWYLNVHRKLEAKIRILTSASPMFVSHQIGERQCSYLTKSAKGTIYTSKDSGVNGIPNLYVHEINKYYWSPEGNYHTNVVSCVWRNSCHSNAVICIVTIAFVGPINGWISL